MKVSFKYLRPLNIHNFVNELHHLAVWGRSCLTLCIAQTKFWNKDIEIDPNLCLYSNAAAAAAESLQSCPTLWDPIDGSPPGSPVPGILQARTLEWVALSFSNAWKWKVKVKSLSRVWLLATPWTAAHQAPPSMGFSRQEYWSWVPSPSPYSNDKTVFIYPWFSSCG